MSYCRFSSCDWWSDIYCYADVSGGYTIHVAAGRILGDIPKAEHLWAEGKLDEFLEAHRAQMDFLNTAERELIGLPHDGETFNFSSAGEAAKYLQELSELGYHVPQHAIDWLIEDSEEA